MDLNQIIQELSNTYTMMLGLDIKGSSSISHAICLQTLEKLINQFKSKQDELVKELNQKQQ